MTRYCFLILFVGILFGFSGKVSACSTPMGISGPDTVCVGSGVTFSDMTTGGSWSSSNSSLATIDSVTGLFTGVTGGSVTITYTIPPGCFVTRNIFVDPLPITGTTAICLGSSGLFSDLSPGGTWNSSNTTVATVNASTGAEDGVGSGTTVIGYTLPNGCSSQVVATVNPLPLNFYVFGGGDYCAGTSGATVALSWSDSGINYLLYNGSTLVDSLYGMGGALFYGPYTAAGTYEIYGVNIVTRCANRMSGIATIGVIPDNVPYVNILTSGVGDTFCIMANATFTAVPTDAGAIPAYQWYVNGASAGTGDTYSYTPYEGDEVSVVMTSDAVCAIPSTASSSLDITSIPNVTPSVTISVVPGDTVCTSVYATIIPAPVYGGPTPSYRWIKNGIPVATGPVYHYLPANGDYILCTMHSDYECLVTDSAYTTTGINMTVVPLLIPTVTVTAYPGDTIQEGQRDTFIATVVNGGTVLAYQWEVNGTSIPGATSDTFSSSTFSGTDTVSCIVSSSSFCGGEPANAFVVIRDTDTVIHNVGIAMPVFSNDGISIIPNPNRGIFTINGQFAVAADRVTIEITDVIGQAVHKDVIPLYNGKLKTQIDLGEELANGVYLIHFSANGANAFGKFVLNR